MAGAGVILSGALSSASQLGGASSGNQMGYGLGSKILGPAGDPAGAIYQMIVARKQREEEKRKFDEQMALENQKLEENKRQFNVASQGDNRDRNMAGIQMLGQMRETAMTNQRGKVFRDQLLNAFGA